MVWGARLLGMLARIQRNTKPQALDPNSSGFEHNLQSLRVVDCLETCCLSFNGFNLNFEAGEEVLKYCSQRNVSRLESKEPHGVAH